MTPAHLAELQAAWPGAWVPSTVQDDDDNAVQMLVHPPYTYGAAFVDEDGLVVARGELVYAVLNLYPYNPGHLMVVPYRRVAELENLTEAESAELMAFTQKAIRVMKAVSRPHGFNVGLNLGTSAGGSLSEHLHMHVVPRWGGDANFITVIGDSKVIPQLLRDTRQLLATEWDKRSE